MSDQIDLSKMEKKIIIRTVKEEDIADIVELSKICFPDMEPWTTEHLQSHIAVFPEGQFCVEYDGRIIGASSSLIIDFNEYEDRHTFDEITDNGYITNHDSEGKHLYGISIMVHPDFRRLHVGTRIYETRKELVQRLNLKSFLVGGRIPFYHKYADQMTAAEYVQQVIQQKIHDPVLSFQLMNEFKLKWVNPDYLGDDKASLSYAVLLEWSNVDYLPKSKRLYLRARYCAQARAVENEIYTVISGTVGNLTHVPRTDTMYAQSGIFSPSNFPFPRDGIVGECSANIETIVIGEVDLEILRRNRSEGTVTHLKDRRRDLYKIIENQPAQKR